MYYEIFWNQFDYFAQYILKKIVPYGINVSFFNKVDDFDRELFPFSK